MGQIFFLLIKEMSIMSETIFFCANTVKSVLQGGPPESTLSSTTFLHPDWGHYDHHMPDLVILQITRCH